MKTLLIALLLVGVAISGCASNSTTSSTTRALTKPQLNTFWIVIPNVSFTVPEDDDSVK